MAESSIEPSEVSFKEKQKLFQDKQNSTEAQKASIPMFSGGSSVPYSAGITDKEEEFPRLNRRPSVRERINIFQSSPSFNGATTTPSTNSIESSAQGKSVESVNTSQGTLLADRYRSADGSRSTGRSRSISFSAGPTGRSSSPSSMIDQPAFPRCVTASSGQSSFQTRVSDFSQNDKSSEHSSISTNLRRQRDEYQILLTAKQQLETNLGRQRDEYQILLTAKQQLEARLDGRDELAPFNVPHLPNLEACLGSGSYGSVHRIQLNGLSCIAKQIHNILLGQGREERVSLEDKRAAYEKFFHECVLLSRMRHPNIVQFMGVHYGQQREYGRELTLIMESLPMDLEECLRRYRNLELSIKVSLLLDVCQGLLHLHAHGIVHRDLTAGNVLLTTGLQAKIADLGVSKILNVHPLAASKQSMIPGTLGYMPPEALSEHPQYGCALDIFSFGVLMLYVAIQEYPQYYENVVTVTTLQRQEIQIKKRLKWINKLKEDDPIRTVVCNCLQDEPQKRPTTSELNATLVQFSQHHPKSYTDVIHLQRHLEHQVSELTSSCQRLQQENAQLQRGVGRPYNPNPSGPSVQGQQTYYNTESPRQPSHGQHAAAPTPLPRQQTYYNTESPRQPSHGQHAAAPTPLPRQQSWRQNK